MKNLAIKTSIFRITFSAVFTILLATIFVPAALSSELPSPNLPTLGDASSEYLTPMMERKLGEEIMHSIRDDNDYIDDEVTVEYLNNFGSKLLEVHQEARGEANVNFYFFAVRDPMVNAFALPGGFIGVHSELILTAQNESQLASVLSHEIGHVAQRHIARMIGNQQQDALIPITSLILAALTMRASPDAAMALAMGGQGLAAQRQLNFSQNAEREADRVGLQILRDGGYDPTDMVTFFERMQNSTRNYSDHVPAFLRSHPMTTERIADIQSRIRSDKFKKHQDSPDFQLFRARIRVLQDDSTQGLLNAKNYFEYQIKDQPKPSISAANSAANYGLAFIAFKQANFKKAQQYLDKAQKESGSGSSFSNANLFFTDLQLAILLTSKQNAEALKKAEIALQQFPISRAIGYQYVDALIANQQGEKAIAYLRDQTLLYRSDFGLQKQLAKAYASENKEALEHLALAEYYALTGAISPALDQLDIARNAPDANYFDLAIIDARERELRERYKEELGEHAKRGEKQGG